MKKTKIGSVYKVTNITNKKCYIGQTIMILDKRKYFHEKSKTHCIFHRAIRKYEKESFKWEVLCECESKNELDEMEFHYIKQYHSHVSEYGYNLTWGGEGSHGRKHSKETKKKISESSKSHWLNSEYKQKIHTNDSKIKTSKSIKQLWYNEEYRKNFISKTTGQKRNKEVKENMSKRMKKMYSDPSERIKQSDNVSKFWKVISPDGVSIIIKNLRKFCDDNDLNMTGMWRVSKNIQNTYKGWSCEKIGVIS